MPSRFSCSAPGLGHQGPDVVLRDGADRQAGTRDLGRERAPVGGRDLDVVVEAGARRSSSWPHPRPAARPTRRRCRARTPPRRPFTEPLTMNSPSGRRNTVTSLSPVSIAVPGISTASIRSVTVRSSIPVGIARDGDEQQRRPEQQAPNAARALPRNRRGIIQASVKPHDAVEDEVRPFGAGDVARGPRRTQDAGRQAGRAAGDHGAVRSQRCAERRRRLPRPARLEPFRARVGQPGRQFGHDGEPSVSAIEPTRAGSRSRSGRSPGRGPTADR